MHDAAAYRAAPVLGTGRAAERLQLALVVPVCLPFVLLAVAMQLLISATTRSMEVAQTDLGLLPLVLGLAGMVVASGYSRIGLIPTVQRRFPPFV